MYKIRLVRDSDQFGSIHDRSTKWHVREIFLLWSGIAWEMTDFAKSRYTGQHMFHQNYLLQMNAFYLHLARKLRV